MISIKSVILSHVSVILSCVWMTIWREMNREGRDVERRRGGGKERSGLAFWLEYFALIPKKTTKIQVNSNNCKSSLVWITST